MLPVATFSCAFSLSIQFNLSDWLEQYAPPTTDCTQLLGYVYHGIEWCGHTPEHEHLALCGVRTVCVCKVIVMSHCVSNRYIAFISS